MQPQDLEKLVTWKMPFGKHQGKLLVDLPGNYLNWFAREGFPAGEIGRLLQVMQEIDHHGYKDGSYCYIAIDHFSSFPNSFSRR